MSTYNPPSFPRRPKRSTLFTELVYHCHLAYYRYEINTALYVMSPGEKFAFNFILLSFLALLLSAVYYYLPSAVFISIQRLAYYFTGSSRLDVAATMVPAADMLQSSAGREVLASLADAGGLVDAAGGNGSLMFGS